MVEERLPSKFAFILHADVAGSTTLVQQDEELAHKRIQATFRRFGDIITHYHGQVRELRGDALLAEFERASDAVTAALVFLAGQSDYLAQLDDNILPAVRVGIAMGEVISADNTLTGAGVVLAQRVEQLAEPGGVCITGAIQEALPPRLPFDQDDLGEQQVKGFDNPVRVYRVGLKEGADLPEPTVVSGSRRSKVAQFAIVAAVVVLICGGALLAWHRPWAPDFEPALVENMAFPLPKEPSIAVLPFDNFSGDESQDFLADGLTENIITTLARSPYLFVIARNSTFVYKDKAVPIKQVAEELGVRHVLEGSVQREGDRVRITAQLIDAVDGRHIWAQRYDRKFEHILALQDEITEKLMVELHAEITEGYDYRDLRARVRTPEAFELLMKARELLLRGGTKEDHLVRKELLAKAAAIEPDNPEIWLYQAWMHWREYQHRWSDDRQASFEKAEELGKKVDAAVPNYSAAVGFLGLLALSRGEHEKAIEYGRRSVELAPSSALDKARLAWFLAPSGHPEEAITLVQKAMRLSPSYPAWFVSVLAFAYMVTGDYDNAIAGYEQLVERKNSLLRAHTRLAGIHAVLGNDEKASEHAAAVLKIKPDFTIQGWKDSVWYKYPEDLERELNMLRKAGLPD